MKLLKRDYKRLIDELYKIGNKMIFIDCFIDNYNYETFKLDYKHLIATQITQDNFIEIIAEIVNNITSKKSNFKELLDKLIFHNNSYIETAGFHKDSFDELKTAFEYNYVPSIHKRGVTPNMMLLYYFSKNIFSNKLVDQLIEYYIVYDKIIEEEQEKHKKEALNFFKNTEKPSIEMLELNNFANEHYTNAETVNWNDIGSQFECNYDEESKAFNNVKPGIMLFLNSKIFVFSELSAKIDTFYTAIKQYSKKINISLEKQELIVKQLTSLKEENTNLQNKYKKARKQMLELEKTINQIKKEDTKAKDKQIIDLTKENSYLKLRIETLEQQIEQLLEAQEINKTIAEDIQIEEEPQKTTAITKELPEYQSIVVLGGNWNSKEKENLHKALPTCDIQFIESEKTLAKIDRIANADIVIFDASRNAHGYYYKAKQFANRLLHISKSKADEVIGVWKD